MNPNFLKGFEKKAAWTDPVVSGAKYVGRKLMSGTKYLGRGIANQGNNVQRAGNWIAGQGAAGGKVQQAGNWIANKGAQGVRDAGNWIRQNPGKTLAATSAATKVFGAGMMAGRATAPQQPQQPQM